MPEQLPPNPSIYNLKKQAKQLLKDLKAGSTEACDRIRAAMPRWQNITDNIVLQAEVPLRDAQQVIAREYNFSSWQQMTTEVQRTDWAPADLLANALEAQDTIAIADLMKKHPHLFDEEPPYNAMRQALREHQIDLIRFLLVQGLDPDARPSGGAFRNSPLRSATSNPMRNLLLEYGADVNHGADTPPYMAVIHGAAWNPEAIEWLLGHGANPNVLCEDYGGLRAIDFACGGGNYAPNIHGCLEALINGGATYQNKDGPAIDLLRGRMDLLEKRMDKEPEVLTAYHMRSMGHGGYPDGAPLGLGATLLHLAAEHDDREAAKWLLNRGTDVNAPCRPDGRSYEDMRGDHPDYEVHRETWRNTPFEASEDGRQNIGKQTPVFHAVNHSYAMTKLLIDRGADLSYRASIRTGDWASNTLLDQVTPLGYALKFNATPIDDIVSLLKEHGATE